MWGFNAINWSCEYGLINLRKGASGKNPPLPGKPVFQEQQSLNIKGYKLLMAVVSASDKL